MKIPEAAIAASGTNKIRGTTLIVSNETTSDSNKSYPDNGGSRAPLLIAFGRANSGIRSPRPSAPAHTNRRLSGAFEKGEFSFNVLLLLLVRI